MSWERWITWRFPSAGRAGSSVKFRGPDGYIVEAAREPD
jgi:hypothetical protein